MFENVKTRCKSCKKEVLLTNDALLANSLCPLCGKGDLEIIQPSSIEINKQIREIAAMLKGLPQEEIQSLSKPITDLIHHRKHRRSKFSSLWHRFKRKINSKTVLTVLFIIVLLFLLYFGLVYLKLNYPYYL